MVIGLCGPISVGKDTVANYLVDQHDFRKQAFADKLKEAVAILWNIPREDVDVLKNVANYVSVSLGGGSRRFSWRNHLQRFGTEMSRHVFGEDFWINFVLPSTVDRVAALRWGQSTQLVISDLRFFNEAERIKFVGGYIVEISGRTEYDESHQSEMGIPPDFIDASILNNGSLQELYSSVEEILGELNEGS